MKTVDDITQGIVWGFLILACIYIFLLYASQIVGW